MIACEPGLSFASARELSDWAKGTLDAKGLGAVVSADVVKERSYSRVVRLQTDRGLWFWGKSTGDPYSHESLFTDLLARTHPCWFPEVIATSETLHATLTSHVAGPELFASDNPTAWEETVLRLGRLQVDYCQGQAPLRTLGLPIWDTERILGNLDLLFDRANIAMERQESRRSPALSRIELDMLQTRVRTACLQSEDLGIPPSLANGDFSPHNVLLSNRGPIFLDWAEACITLPFVTGEYLWNRMAVEAPDRREWKDRLRAVYRAVWIDWLGARTTDAALQLSPILAVLLLALRTAVEPAPSIGSAEEVLQREPLLRALTRRLHKEVVEWSR